MIPITPNWRPSQEDLETARRVLEFSRQEFNNILQAAVPSIPMVIIEQLSGVITVELETTDQIVLHAFVRYQERIRVVGDEDLPVTIPYFIADNEADPLTARIESKLKIGEITVATITWPGPGKVRWMLHVLEEAFPSEPDPMKAAVLLELPEVVRCSECEKKMTIATAAIDNKGWLLCGDCFPEGALVGALEITPPIVEEHDVDATLTG